MKILLSLLLMLSLAFSFLCLSISAGGIGWEAENAKAVNPPMQVFSDLPDASGGKYISSPTANQGSVEYEIEVPKGGKYYLWVHFRSQDTGSNSWFLQVDNAASVIGNDDFAWDTIVPDLMPKQVGEKVGPLAEPGPAWDFGNKWWWLRLLGRIDKQFDVLTIRVLELGIGSHTLYLWNREANTKADAFYLSDTFGEQPVFPDKAQGIQAVSLKDKLATSWGLIRARY